MTTNMDIAELEAELRNMRREIADLAEILVHLSTRADALEDAANQIRKRAPRFTAGTSYRFKDGQ